MAANAVAHVITLRSEASPRAVRSADSSTHGIRKYAIQGRCPTDRCETMCPLTVKINDEQHPRQQSECEVAAQRNRAEKAGDVEPR